MQTVYRKYFCPDCKRWTLGIINKQILIENHRKTELIVYLCNECNVTYNLVPFQGKINIIYKKGFWSNNKDGWGKSTTTYYPNMVGNEIDEVSCRLWRTVRIEKVKPIIQSINGVDFKTYVTRLEKRFSRVELETQSYAITGH